MSDLINKVAELLKAPASLVQRSAEARAAASGSSVDDVLNSWLGGENITTSTPKEAPVEEVVETVEEVKEEAPVEEVVETVVEKENVVAVVTKQIKTTTALINETMNIKVNPEVSLPRWLNLSFIIIPVFILIGLITTSNTQECGERGVLDIDRKSQEAVNCDGSPFEGKGVAATNSVNYVALGQEIYSGAAACGLSWRWGWWWSWTSFYWWCTLHNISILCRPR